MIEQIISSLIGAQMDAHVPLDDLTAMQLVARSLSSEIAARTTLGAEQAYTALTYIPANMLSMLDSPEGWSALASYVALDERVPDPALVPTIH